MIKFKKKLPTPSFIANSDEINTDFTTSDLQILLNEINNNKIYKKNTLKILVHPYFLLLSNFLISSIGLIFLNFKLQNYFFIIILSFTLFLISFFSSTIKEKINQLTPFFFSNYKFSENHKNFWLSNIKWFVDNTNQKSLTFNNKKFKIEKLYSHIEQFYDNAETKHLLSSLLFTDNSILLTHIKQKFLPKKDINLQKYFSNSEPLFYKYYNKIKNLFEKKNTHHNNIKTSFNQKFYYFFKNENICNYYLFNQKYFQDIIPKINHLLKLKLFSKYMFLSIFTTNILVFFLSSTPIEIPLYIMLFLGVVFTMSNTLIKTFLGHDSYNNLLINFSFNNNFYSFIKKHESEFYNTFYFIINNLDRSYPHRTISKISSIMHSWKTDGLTEVLSQEIFTFIIDNNLENFFYQYINKNCSEQTSINQGNDNFRLFKNNL